MVPVSKWSLLIREGEEKAAKTRYGLYGTRESIPLSGIGARALTNVGRRVSVVFIRNLRMRHERFPREIQYGQDSMHTYLDKIFGSRIRANWRSFWMKKTPASAASFHGSTRLVFFCRVARENARTSGPTLLFSFSRN
jgi:hypothetical protein